MTPRSPPSRRRRGALHSAALRPIALIVIALFALLGAAHVAYWYLPRQRTGALDAATPAGELLLFAPGARLWVPFPHQSPLAASLLDLGAGAAGGSPLPRFGPLRLPPARELAVARSADATTLVVRVYPSWALVGKLAGRLTGNPWLRAGSFQQRGERVEVAWRGTSWIVTARSRGGEPSRDTRRSGATPTHEGDGVPPRLAAAFALDGELFAGQRSGESGVDLGGVWGLERIVEAQGGSEGEAELVRVDVPGSTTLASRPQGRAPPDDAASSSVSPVVSLVEGCADAGARELALCWLESVPSPAGDSVAGERALILLAPRAPFDRHVFRLPSAASLVRGRAGGPPPRRVSLPAESLARRLDARLLTGARSGWEITALDEPSLAVAGDLADDWAATSQPQEAPEISVWIRPGALTRAAREVAGAFSNLPFVDDDDAEGWRLASTILDGMESLDAVMVLVRSDTILVRWTRSVSPPAPSPRSD